MLKKQLFYSFTLLLIFFWCIVEFPAVLLNTNSGEIESEFHMYVQPQEHTKLSDFCKELTGITQVCSEKHHFNADRGILIFLMFLSENVVNCSIYGKTSLFATLLFFLRSLFSGQKSKSCGQGFKNRPVTARVLLATCKVLPVTLVKIITFWPLMNFLQSPTFVKSGAYLKTI